MSKPTDLFDPIKGLAVGFVKVYALIGEEILFLSFW